MTQETETMKRERIGEGMPPGGAQSSKTVKIGEVLCQTYFFPLGSWLGAYSGHSCPEGEAGEFPGFPRGSPAAGALPRPIVATDPAPASASQVAFVYTPQQVALSPASSPPSGFPARRSCRFHYHSGHSFPPAACSFSFSNLFFLPFRKVFLSPTPSPVLWSFGE